jgi:hypothetical protein
MQFIEKTLLRLVVEGAARIGFFYAGLLPAAYAVGFVGAGLVYASSFVPGLGRDMWPVGQSFFDTAILYALAGFFAMLVFAISIELLHLAIGDASPWLYVGGAVAVMAAYVRPEGASVGSVGACIVLVADLLLAAAVAGAVYWFVTIRLRAALAIVARRLVGCGRSHMSSCAVFEGRLKCVHSVF